LNIKNMFTPTTPDPNILSKLRSYYPGLSSMDDDLLWIKFIKVWDKLMALLCWNDGECNSLLENEREIIVKLEQFCGTVEINLKHKNVTVINSVFFKWLTSSGFQTLEVENADNFRDENKLYLILNPVQLKQLNTCF